MLTRFSKRRAVRCGLPWANGVWYKSRVISLIWKPRSNQDKALRGGAILLIGSAILVACWWQKGRGFSAWSSWVLSLWLIFPVGVWLGWWLPRNVSGKARMRTVGLGLLVGCLVGVALALGITGMLRADELIGLLKHRGHGGYDSYRYSVLKSIHECSGLAVWTVVT
jgi:hypothetical protein